jgi:antitoxin CptB
MEGSKRVRKLKWLCRRGMKELDILLERFVTENEASLAAGAWPELESLLETEDDVLWDWFQDPAKQAKGRYGDLLKNVSRGPG